MIYDSQKLSQVEQQVLASYAVKNNDSQGRQHKESPDQYRLPFQVDRDRIIHSRAFRRLQDKTQVFISGSGDHFRSRLTHTMEVAQVSRDIARTLGLNEDLAETIALAHDLGHTPFGHSGETALNQMMQQFDLGFEHNQQSKRTVEILETPYPNFHGLNLTQETIDGLMKHQSPYDNVTKTFRFLPSLEAQVVNLADEIAYTAHDTDDGLRSKIITPNDLQVISLWQQAQNAATNQYGSQAPTDRIISKLLGLLIEDVCITSNQTLASAKIKTLEDVHHHKGKLIHFSQSIRESLIPLRQLLYQQLYFSPQVSKSMKQGQQIIKDLFKHYLANSSQVPQKYFQSATVAATQLPLSQDQQKAIAIKDFIAGMTDTYVTKSWHQIK